MVRVKDSINVDDFLVNFEPYLVDENGDEYKRTLDLQIGDKNSDVIFDVHVYDISEEGFFKFDIEDVENVELDELDMLMEDQVVWDTINDFITDNVVFDETH